MNQIFFPSKTKYPQGSISRFSFAENFASFPVKAFMYSPINLSPSKVTYCFSPEKLKIANILFPFFSLTRAKTFSLSDEFILTNFPPDGFLSPGGTDIPIPAPGVYTFNLILDGPLPTYEFIAQ